MADVPRETEPLDPFERAVAFAIERAQRRDREEAERRRTMRVVERRQRGGSAA